MPSTRGSSRPRDQTCVSSISWVGRRALDHKCHPRRGITGTGSCSYGDREVPPPTVSWRPGVTHSDSKGLRPGALMSKGWRRWTAQLRWNQGKELAALLNMCVCKHARSCLTLQPHGLQPARLFCPLDFPGKNTGVGCQFLLQGLLPTQGSNPHLMSPALAGAFFTINATCEAPQTA